MRNIIEELNAATQRIERLEAEVATIKEYMIASPTSIPNLLEQFRFYEGDVQAFQEKCNGNYDALFTNMLNQFTQLEKEIKLIKKKINEVIQKL